MILSKSCEYAVKALIFLIVKTKEAPKSSLKEIAKSINSPEAFTSKVLQSLVNKDLVQSSKGKGGGFSMEAKVVQRVSIWDVVLAIDGSDIQDRCFLGLDKCSSSNPCAAHFAYLDVKAEIMEFMKKSKLIVLAEQVGSGETFLKSK